MDGNEPDLILPGETEKAEKGVFISRIIAETAIEPEHLEAEITYSLADLEIKRVFRLYPDCPAIACDFYFKGKSSNVWLLPGTNLADMVNMEKLTPGNAVNNTPVIEKLDLPGKHWQLNVVEFFDVTDRHNNLVRSLNVLSYRPNYYRGNLLVAQDKLSNKGIFILKEAPTSSIQLDYPGSDFITDFGNFRAIGIGISPADLKPNRMETGIWFRYWCFFGQ